MYFRFSATFGRNLLWLEFSLFSVYYSTTFEFISKFENLHVMSHTGKIINEKLRIENKFLSCLLHSNQQNLGLLQKLLFIFLSFWLNLFLNFCYATKLTKLNFFYYKPIFTSKNLKLHYMTYKWRTEIIKLGPFSIRWPFYRCFFGKSL